VSDFILFFWFRCISVSETLSNAVRLIFPLHTQDGGGEAAVAQSSRRHNPRFSEAKIEFHRRKANEAAERQRELDLLLVVYRANKPSLTWMKTSGFISCCSREKSLQISHTGESEKKLQIKASCGWSLCVSMVNMQTSCGWDHLVSVATPSWNSYCRPVVGLGSCTYWVGSPMTLEQISGSGEDFKMMMLLSRIACCVYLLRCSTDFFFLLVSAFPFWQFHTIFTCLKPCASSWVVGDQPQLFELAKCLLVHLACISSLAVVAPTPLSGNSCDVQSMAAERHTYIQGAVKK